MFRYFLWLPLLLFGMSCLALESKEHVVELTIVEGKVSAQTRVIKVVKGDKLRLRFSSDKTGDVHLHAYRLQTKVQPGQVSELAFQAFATGKFRFEWHDAQQKNKGGHHADALATLEVRPN